MNPINSQILDTRLKVFYDGQCVVCAKEIEIYARIANRKRIQFVDISSPLFDASQEKLDPIEIKKVFHVKDSEDKVYRGVDGFIAIWEILEIFPLLSYLAKSSLTRPLFDLGYLIFSKIRPFLPRKSCQQGNCHI